MVLSNKSYYNTVTSVSFSPCGNFFICGNVQGDLVLFNLNHLITNVENVDENISKITKNRFSLDSEKKINSLTSSDSFLIIGLVGEIIGWKWQDIINADIGKIPPNAWKIPVPASNNRNPDVVSEVNSLKIGGKPDAPGDILYAGCGDNNVHSFSLEDGRVLRTYSGHTNYVHSVDTKENLIVSGSEDGSIRMWDNRTSALVNCIEPYKHKEISRPHLGNWIGDVSLNEDWLVCGGGSRLSLWNMRTIDCPMSVFTKTRDDGIHIAQFHQDGILAGGASPYLSVLNLNDELTTGIQISSSIIYSCAISSERNQSKALSIVGNSNDIDVSTNFSYRECVVPFY